MNFSVRLGLLFLTRGDVNHPDIWDEFVSSGTSDLRVFSHAKFHEAAECGFLKGSSVSIRHETAWGHISLVRAMLELLKEAMQDSSLTHFVFLSESCIPVKSWLRIKQSLHNDPRSMIMATGVDDMDVCHSDRYNFANGIPLAAWKVHSQWSLLNRDAAMCVLKNDMTKHFEAVFAADEHYIGTILKMNGYCWEKINSQDCNWVDWNLSRPGVFMELDTDLLAKLIQFPGFFARKFPVGADLARLRMILSNDFLHENAY